jgi:hypothetical protein
LGIVYILKDGSLSPVFNIRGATNIPVFKGIPSDISEENIPTCFAYRVDSEFNTYVKNE